MIDIRSGTAASSPSNFQVVGGNLYFNANDGTNGVELWKHNGTTASMVADVNSGGGSSNPGEVVLVGSTLYFTADDGTHGAELRKLNGTTASLVADIAAGSASSTPQNFVTNGTALFFTASESIHGREVWSSDGTASGTAMVKDIAPGSADSNASLAAVLDSKVIFSANDGNGPALWMAPPDPDYTDLYYTANWQVIEEREDGSTDASNQYVWSPVYVDALILRDRDADSDIGSGDLGVADSGLELRIYYQQDANFNVTAITDTSGVVQERYLYDPYGEVTITDATYDPKDGNESDFDSNYLFQGKRYGRQVFLYDSRKRPYSVTLGWLSVDPLGYPDGLSRYARLGNNPIRFTDPNGTEIRVFPSTQTTDAGSTVAAAYQSIVGVAGSISSTNMGSYWVIKYDIHPQRVWEYGCSVSWPPYAYVWTYTETDIDRATNGDVKEAMKLLKEAIDSERVINVYLMDTDFVGGSMRAWGYGAHYGDVPVRGGFRASNVIVDYTYLTTNNFTVDGLRVATVAHTWEIVLWHETIGHAANFIAGRRYTDFDLNSAGHRIVNIVENLGRRAYNASNPTAIPLGERSLSR